MCSLLVTKKSPWCTRALSAPTTHTQLFIGPHGRHGSLDMHGLHTGRSRLQPCNLHKSASCPYPPLISLSGKSCFPPQLWSAGQGTSPGRPRLSTLMTPLQNYCGAGRNQGKVSAATSAPTKMSPPSILIVRTKLMKLQQVAFVALQEKERPGK